MSSYFSEPNNTKYLLPSKILRNPSMLSNLMRKVFGPIKALYKMPQIKIFS